MNSIFQNIHNRWLIVAIAIIYITGLFLPYSEQGIFLRPQDFSSLRYPITYGWEDFTYRLFFLVSAGIIALSFSPWIAIRLLIIFFALVFMIPTTILAYVADSSYIAGTPYPQQNKIAMFLNYTGMTLTIVYGFLHFRKSYKVYKEMLKNYKKESLEDLLDSF